MKTISEIGKVVTGSTPSTKEDAFYGGEHLFVGPGDLGEHRDIDSSEKTLTEEGFAEGRPVPERSVLFTCISFGIGKTGLAARKLATNQQINSVVPHDQRDSEYLYYYLDFMADRIKLLAGLQATPILNKTEFSKVKVALPPSDERCRIAEILATWDRALALIGDLIEAKQRRLTGLMQRLLTGAERFPEFVESEGRQESRVGSFPEDWRLVQIDQIADVNRESLLSDTEDDYEFWYVSLEDVDKGKVEMPAEKIAFGDAPSRAKRVLTYRDVIMSTVRPNLLGFAIADFDTTDIVCSTGFALISAHRESDAKLVYYSLYSDAIMRQVKGLVTGSNYPAINNGEVANLKLPYPRLAEEREKN